MKYPLPIVNEALCLYTCYQLILLYSVAHWDTKARRNMMTMARPYRLLQRGIGFRVSAPQLAELCILNDIEYIY